MSIGFLFKTKQRSKHPQFCSLKCYHRILLFTDQSFELLVNAYCVDTVIDKIFGIMHPLSLFVSKILMINQQKMYLYQRLKIELLFLFQVWNLSNS